ncbi:MAG: L-aspartate oxidase [Planctomycetota bacterium]|jgi:L-aspartate oxidase
MASVTRNQPDLLPRRTISGPALPRFLAQVHPRELPRRTTDVLVIGGGVAGLSAAITASETRDTLALLKGGRQETATSWAQGGMAVARGHDDRPELHASDTLAVASGLGDPDVTDAVVRGGPDVLDRWIQWGGKFDQEEGADLSLAREGGHSVARIIHSGDRTGQEIQRLLQHQAAGMPRLSVLEHTFVLEGLFGVWAGSTILCTGGAGQVYRETTNPPAATGDGIAMAYRAGAQLRGMEFVQFHPTVLYVAGMSRVLVSEVARGEGAVLRDRNGHRFMPDYHPDAELAPRDVVSRSIVRQLAKVRDSHVYLDMRAIPADRARARFPGIDKACREFGIDITTDLIPVHPACHYMVGGIATDERGRGSLEGLYACGEAASSGLHGANRMGSNSLLEGAVLGHHAGLDAAASGRVPIVGADEPGFTERRVVGDLDLEDLDNALRALMWRLVGIERDGPGLAAALEKLEGWNWLLARREFGDPEGWVLANKMLVGDLIARCALERAESRGTHFRRDHDRADDALWRCELDISRPGAR